MAFKRHYTETDIVGGSGEAEPKRRQTLDTIGRDVMKELAKQESMSKLEPMLRKLVREELERLLLPFIQSFPRSSLNRIDASGSRGWRLHFTNKLPHTIFTGNRIETEDGSPVQVVILDTNSNRIVKTGPLSLVKAEILVLDGDFGSDAKEDWCEEEFDACVIREREGRRPLVTGNLQITLRDGVGYLEDITFTDNSSWTRSRKFRVGAKIARSSCTNEGVREASSEAFIVKDHRGELYRKHHPPSLGDEVWRLEKIAKDGAFHSRLSSNEINKVQDFLRLLNTNPSYLRNILGTGMSNRTWLTIVQHAMSCIMDNKHYMYYDSGSQVGLMFDSIYKLVRVTFDGQSYKSLENITAPQMMLVEGLKHQAYRNPNEMFEIEWPLIDASSVVLPLEGSSFLGLSPDSQLPEFPNTYRGHSARQVGLHNPTNALPYILEDPAQLEDFSDMQGRYLVQNSSSIQRNSFKMKGPLASYSNDLHQWDSGESSHSILMVGDLTGDDFSQVQMPNWLPVNPSWGQGSGIFLASSVDEMGNCYLSTVPERNIHMTRRSNFKIKWFKIRAAVKWVITVRRALAARRRARFMQLGY